MPETLNVCNKTKDIINTAATFQPSIRNKIYKLKDSSAQKTYKKAPSVAKAPTKLADLFK
jgi:hypothetical protein